MRRLWWRTYWRIYRLFHKPRPAGIYIDGTLVDGCIITVANNGVIRVFDNTSNPFWRRENEDTKPDQ
jgi:hypothetical protein